MSNYEEGFNLLDEKFGNGKDNIISLATIACKPNNDGPPRPVVRGVNAYYENGVFYVTTHGKSNKMLQIEKKTRGFDCFFLRNVYRKWDR